MSKFLLACAIVVIGLLAYLQLPLQPNKPLRMAINPWPGYALFHYAKVKGYFKEQGVDIELVQINSLADVLHVFSHNDIDLMTGTLTELISAHNADVDAKVIMLPDFSNGSDMIIANRKIKSISDLMGKRIGVERNSVSYFFLMRLLEKNDIDVEDLNIINISQNNVHELFKYDQIDAAVTYPPFSSTLLADDEKLYALATSAEIPGEIIDVVITKQGVIEHRSQDLIKVIHAWKQAYDDWLAKPQIVNRVMANSIGVDVEKFEEGLNGIKIMPIQEQIEIFRSTKLIENIELAKKLKEKLNQSVLLKDYGEFVASELIQEQKFE